MWGLLLRQDQCMIFMRNKLDHLKYHFVLFLISPEFILVFIYQSHVESFLSRWYVTEVSKFFTVHHSFFIATQIRSCKNECCVSHRESTSKWNLEYNHLSLIPISYDSMYIGNVTAVKRQSFSSSGKIESEHDAVKGLINADKQKIDL